MKTKQSLSHLGYKRRAVSGLQAGIALVVASTLAVRAIDTGSLQQYGLTLLFLGIATYKAFAWKRTGKEQSK